MTKGLGVPGREALNKTHPILSKVPACSRYRFPSPYFRPSLINRPSSRSQSPPIRAIDLSSQPCHLPTPAQWHQTHQRTLHSTRPPAENESVRMDRLLVQDRCAADQPDLLARFSLLFFVKLLTFSHRYLTIPPCAPVVGMWNDVPAPFVIRIVHGNYSDASVHCS